MAVTALSNVQKATVVALVEARRLDVVPADEARASSFMQQAEERLGQLPLLTSPAVRYGIAYDAAHDIGEALLAAYGFRTTEPASTRRSAGNWGDDAVRAEILQRGPAKSRPRALVSHLGRLEP
jgi:hypothetical protein